MTDESGSIVEKADYRPFGEERSYTGTSTNPTSYKYTDQELDTSTGLYNYDARHYDPAIGRFISPDSLIPNLYDPQQLNPYAYCSNNPLIYVDPTGHAMEGDGDSFFGGDASDIPSWGDGPDIGGFFGDIAEGFTNPGHWCRDKGEKTDTVQTGNVVVSGFFDTNIVVSYAVIGKFGALTPEERALFDSQIKEALAYLINKDPTGMKDLLTELSFFDPSIREPGIILAPGPQGGWALTGLGEYVGWDPLGGVQNGVHINSPALVLAHELDHTRDYRQNPRAHERRRNMVNLPKAIAQYDTMEEYRCITKFENPLAEKLGEYQRPSHRGTHVTVDSPTYHSN